jgi:hypothetical protein
LQAFLGFPDGVSAFLPVADTFQPAPLPSETTRSIAKIGRTWQSKSSMFPRKHLDKAILRSCSFPHTRRTARTAGRVWQCTRGSLFNPVLERGRESFFRLLTFRVQAASRLGKMRTSAGRRGSFRALRQATYLPMKGITCEKPNLAVRASPRVPGASSSGAGERTNIIFSAMPDRWRVPA